MGCDQNSIEHVEDRKGHEKRYSLEDDKIWVNEGVGRGRGYR